MSRDYPSISSEQDEIEEIMGLIFGPAEDDGRIPLEDLDVTSQWWEAQRRIIDILISVDEAMDDLEAEKAEAADANRDEKFEECLDAMHELELLEGCARRLADSMAWIMLDLGGRGTLPLHDGRDPVPISTIDVDSHLGSIRDLSDHFDSGIGILTDITSTLQIGDAVFLGFDEGGARTVFLEVKEGEVNWEIDKILSESDEPLEAVHDDDSAVVREIEQSLGEKAVEQARRMVDQLNRSLRNTATWVREEGPVVHSGETQTGFLPDGPKLKRYVEDLREATESVREGGRERLEVDDVLFIEVVNNEDADIDDYIAWINERTSEPGMGGYIRQGLLQPHTRPIFLSDLPRDLILDLLTARILVLYALDLRSLSEKLRDNGIPVEYDSSKEFDTTRKEAPRGSLFQGPRHKGFVIKEGETVYTLGMRIPYRVIFEFVRPLEIPGLVEHSIDKLRSHVESE